jgi:outer membrane protein assembly factor BamE
MDVQQGNAVTQEMVSKLQPGMTRSQVRFALGTPLIVDPFRTDRWDYVYLYQKAGKQIEQRQLAVYFKDDRLVRIEGDVVPSTAPRAAATSDTKPAAAVATPEKGQGKSASEKPEAQEPARERGFFGRMLERLGL